MVFAYEVACTASLVAIAFSLPVLRVKSHFLQ